ncbi:MAG: hypothetical protein KTR30_21730 [Saprospiraceae bacterium]|nr:hypothetical protein [Saprospiraceae bacterium]
MQQTKSFSRLVAVLIAFAFVNTLPAQALDPSSIEKDLSFLQAELDRLSAYYAIRGEVVSDILGQYRESLQDSSSISTASFALFLQEVLGELGDRHSKVDIPDLPNTKFLPFVAAPFENRVLALVLNKATKQYAFFVPKYPYLKSINGIPTQSFLMQIAPRDRKAPRAAFMNRAVKRLKYMERNYATLQQVLPTEFTFEFESEDGTERKVMQLPLELDRRKHTTWDERFYWEFSRLDDEDFSKEEVLAKLFTVENDISYIYIPSMSRFDKAPRLFEKLDQFMRQQKNSKALIIDLRHNGGGVRDMIWALAAYLVPEDAIHVVNLARQRAPLPLSKEWKGDLRRRYLFPMDELDEEEKEVAHNFLKNFVPTVSVSDQYFSKFHFALFNGRKISKQDAHFSGQVYILANERSFSAASVLVAAFQGLPNVTLVGERTDGSSGNSEWIELPISKIPIKLSTMISYQKNGQLFDGVGTKPDIHLPRTLKQILWQEDSQLLQLKKIIQEQISSGQ